MPADPFEQALKDFVRELRRAFNVSPVRCIVEIREDETNPLRFWLEGIDKAIVSESMRQTPPSGPATK